MFKNRGLMVMLPLAMLLAESSFAAGPDLTTLTAAVDFSTVITAIIAVGVAAIGAILAWKGIKMVYAALKGT